MADEKILKDEILNAEELDKVAGGRSGEVYEDAVILYKMGYRGMGNDQGQQWEDFVANVPNIRKAFRALGKKCNIDIKVVLHNKNNSFFSPNVYSIDGKEISRDEFWSLIDEISAAKKK